MGGCLYVYVVIKSYNNHFVTAQILSVYIEYLSKLFYGGCKLLYVDKD